MAMGWVLGTMLLVLPAMAQTTKPVYPESEAGLKQFFQDILNASAAKDRQKIEVMLRSLVLPDPDKFFTRHFGDKIGARLAADYKKDYAKFGPSLAALLFSLNEPKTLTIEITCIQALDDTKAKDYQQLAIAAMQEPTPLYTASITKAGTRAHITLWSIVYFEGQFRLAGKMRGVTDAHERSGQAPVEP
jgi:hypothetical protein